MLYLWSSCHSLIVILVCCNAYNVRTESAWGERWSITMQFKWVRMTAAQNTQTTSRHKECVLKKTNAKIPIDISACVCVCVYVNIFKWIWDCAKRICCSFFSIFLFWKQIMYMYEDVSCTNHLYVALSLSILNIFYFTNLPMTKTMCTRPISKCTSLNICRSNAPLQFLADIHCHTDRNMNRTLEKEAKEAGVQIFRKKLIW